SSANTEAAHKVPAIAASATARAAGFMTHSLLVKVRIALRGQTTTRATPRRREHAWNRRVGSQGRADEPAASHSLLGLALLGFALLGLVFRRLAPRIGALQQFSLYGVVALDSCIQSA